MRTRAPVRLLAAAAILAGLPLLVETTPEDPVRRVDESFDASGLRDLAIDMPVGRLLLTGDDGDRVQAEMTIECQRHAWGSSSCPARAQDVELHVERRGDRLEIDLDGYSTWGSRGMEVTLRVRAPGRLSTFLDLGIGELEVEDMGADLTADVGIGEVTVRMAERDVASVQLDAGIGEASLRGDLGRRESAGLFVKELAWSEGTGRARVRVDLGIGEIDVRLS